MMFSYHTNILIKSNKGPIEKTIRNSNESINYKCFIEIAITFSNDTFLIRLKLQFPKNEN